MEKILLQRIVINCLFYTNYRYVPRIVINCFGDIASGCGWLQLPCHAVADLRAGGHLLLHAGVPLRFTTCLTSYRPYGAGLPHHTPSRQRTTPPPLAVMAVPPLRNEAIRHLLRPWDSPLSSLRVIARRNDEAIHLCQIHVRFNYVECKAFVSKKKRNTYISFPVKCQHKQTFRIITPY